jgi:hypothetical protein
MCLNLYSLKYIVYGKYHYLKKKRKIKEESRSRLQARLEVNYQIYTGI